MQGLTNLLLLHKERFSAPMKLLLGENGEGVRHLESSFKLRTIIAPSSGSEKDLITSNTKVLKGISDFDGNKLESEEVFTVTHIRLGYDTDAAVGKEGVLSYKKAPSTSVRNAVLRFWQDGTKYMEKEVSLLINGDTETNIADGIIQLSSPIVIAGGIPFIYKIEYPEGATPVTGVTEYLETIFIGAKTLRSAKAQ